VERAEFLECDVVHVRFDIAAAFVAVVADCSFSDSCGWEVLEAYEGPVTDLWALTIGHDMNIERRLEELASEASAEPDLTNSSAKTVSDMAKKGLGFPTPESWSRSKASYDSTLVDLVVEEKSRISELFEDLESLVDKYREVSPSGTIDHILSADYPRSLSENGSRILLGRKVFRVLRDEVQSSNYDYLTAQADAPWDEVFDLDDPAIRDAFVALATAAEAKAGQVVRRYIDDAQ